MITKSVLYDVILDRYTIDLNFSIGGLHVRGEDYARLISPIHTEQLRIKDGPSGAMAYYSPQFNVLYVPPYMTGAHPYDKALLLHELTHAVADYKGKNIYAYAGEASGYIVQSGFQMAKGFPCMRPDGSPAGAMWAKAYEIANKHGLAKHGGKGTHIKKAEWLGLGSLINAIEGYKHLTKDYQYASDGIAA